jgi:hypothetical protein
MYNRNDGADGLHETMHQAGYYGYSDRDFAEAIHAKTGVPIRGFRGQELTGNPMTDRWIYSNYWGTELKNHCE